MVQRYVWAAVAVGLPLAITGTACQLRTDTQTVPGRPAFSKAYAELTEAATTRPVSQRGAVRISLSTQGMRLDNFLRYVSDRAGVSIISEAGLDTKVVTVDLVDAEISEALGSVARRLGVQVSRAGNVYFLGSLRPEDKGVLVRKCHRIAGEDLKEAITTLLSEHGRAFAYDDGLAVVGDRVEVLARVAELLDGIDSASAESWVVQLYVIALSESDSSDLGVDISPAATVAYTFAAASGKSGAGLQGSLTAGLNALLAATRERKSIRLVSSPMLVLREGVLAKINKGVSVPVARASISPQGTVSTVQFDNIQTGLQIATEVRDMGEGRGRLKLSVGISDITGYITSNGSQAPITANQSLETEADIQSAGVYLLGQFSRKDDTQSITSVTQSRAARLNSGDLLQVWCRSYRIAGPVKQEYDNSVDRPMAPLAPTTAPFERVVLPSSTGLGMAVDRYRAARDELARIDRLSLEIDRLEAEIASAPGTRAGGPAPSGSGPGAKGGNVNKVATTNISRKVSR